MKIYLEELHRLKIFHKKDVFALSKEDSATKELLRRYKKEGFISQIRRDLYAVTDLATKASIASKFEIAAQITPSSYLSYHSALEYHGLAHQVFYELYVSSDDRFNNFEYEEINYLYCESKSQSGVVCPATDTLVKVTNLERTVIDCIDDIHRSGGLEELVVCFSLITYLNEEKLLAYLGEYHKKALYQKTGFLLSYFQKEMKLSADFFSKCKINIGKSVRYLTDAKESNTYFNAWKLYAPANILAFLGQGGTQNV